MPVPEPDLSDPQYWWGITVGAVSAVLLGRWRRAVAAQRLRRMVESHPEYRRAIRRTRRQAEIEREWRESARELH